MLTPLYRSLSVLTLPPVVTAAAWTPAQLSAGAQMLAWYEPRLMSVTSGTAISALTDFSGNGNTTALATGCTTPTFYGVGGVVGVAFDGVNNSLRCGSITSTTLQTQGWVFVLWRCDALVYNGAIWSCNQKNICLARPQTNAQYELDWVQQDSTTAIITYNVGDCIPLLTTWSNRGQSCKVQSPTTSSSGQMTNSTTGETVVLGCRWEQAYADKGLLKLAIFGSGTLTTTDITNLMAYGQAFA